MEHVSISNRNDRLAALELHAHLLKKGFKVTLYMTDRMARAGYVKSLSAAMARINPFLKKGLSANDAIEKVLSMEKA